MRTITVYDVNDEVYFIKKSKKVNIINGTEYQVCYPLKGIVIATLSGIDGYYTIKDRNGVVYEVPYNKVFASWRDATPKAYDYNKKIVSQLRDEIDNLEKNYVF